MWIKLKTHQWLRSGGLKAEKRPKLLKCMEYRKFEETIDHVLTACPALPRTEKTEYINQHNKKAACKLEDQPRIWNSHIRKMEGTQDSY